MNQNFLTRLKKLEEQADISESLGGWHGPVVPADLSELSPEERAMVLAIGLRINGKDGVPVSVEQLEMLTPEELSVVRKLVESAATRAIAENALTT